MHVDTEIIIDLSKKKKKKERYMISLYMRINETHS